MLKDKGCTDDNNDEESDIPYISSAHDLRSTELINFQFFVSIGICPRVLELETHAQELSAKLCMTSVSLAKPDDWQCYTGTASELITCYHNESVHRCCTGFR